MTTTFLVIATVALIVFTLVIGRAARIPGGGRLFCHPPDQAAANMFPYEPTLIADGDLAQHVVQLQQRWSCLPIKRRQVPQLNQTNELTQGRFQC